MSTKKVRQLLAAVLSIVMILSLVVVPAGAAVPMGGEAVAETPVEASGAAPESDRGAVRLKDSAELSAEGDLTGAIGDAWTFGDLAGTQSTNDGTAAWAFKGLQFSIGTKAHSGAYIDMAANDCTITVPVAGKCNVEVTTQYGGVGEVGTDGDMKVLKGDGTGTNHVTTYCYAAETAGTVTIKRTTNTVYVKQIEIKTFDDSLKGEVGDVWDFSDAGFQALGSEALTAWKGLTISNAFVHSSKYIRLGAPATVAIPVAGKCDVEVTTEYGAPGLIGVDADTVELKANSSGTPTTTVWHYDAATAGTVTVSSPNGNSDSVYLTKIEVKEYTDPAPAITVDPESATVSMASKTDTTVTAQSAEVAINYANIAAADMSTVTAAAADTDVVSAEVNADKTKVTLTPGTKAGKTTVTVTATPTDTTVEALTAEIAVENVDPDVLPTQWDFRTNGGKDTRGLEISGKWSYNGATYGVAVGNTGVISVPVSGPSTITVTGGYSWEIGVGDAHDPTRYGTAQGKEYVDDDGVKHATVDEVFTYTGGPGRILVSAVGSTSTYLAGLKVEALDGVTPNHVDVWDFGAEAMDTTLFTNKLTVEKIVAQYPAGTEAKTGVPIPKEGFNFDNGELTFDTAGFENHRLRTTNTAIPRHDEKSLRGAEGADPYTTEVTKNPPDATENPNAVIGGKTYTGYVYSNKGSNTDVKLGMKLNAGDKVTFLSGSNGGTQTYHFKLASDTTGEGEIGNYTAAAKAEPLTFVAKETGDYVYYGSDEKLVVARVYREPAVPVTVTGSFTGAGADFPAGAKLVFTDTATGVKTEATISGETYTVTLNNYLSGASFNVALEGGESYIVGVGDALELTMTDREKTHNVQVVSVDLVNVSGTVTGGLTAADLGNVEISAAAQDNTKIYVPKITVNADGTFSTQLEKSVAYNISAKYVNDFTLTTTSMTKDADDTAATIAFEKKALQTVTVTTDPADVDLSAATLTFTKLSETETGKSEVDDKHPDGYVYTFTGTADIKLRDGQYKVKLDGAPLPNKLIADVKVEGAAATMTITFVTSPYVPAGNHGFASITDDSFNSAVVGITFTDFAAHTGGHGPIGQANAAVKLNLEKAATVTITTCCYGNGTDVTVTPSGTVAAADGTEVNGDKVAKVFTITDVPAGEATFTFAGTTYIHEIKVQYTAPLTTEDVTLEVGADKTYKTINEALAAVEEMNRADGVRAIIMIDPGDYYEMVWVKSPNVTFKNAAANPSIALKNKGLDTEEGAVRISWYYGCGFDYYSMGANSKFDAEQFEINKANGYVSHPNSAGGGSNNECWWNATTVISAEGFRAENIIFENSFNQYVSAAEAADVVVPNAGAKQDSTKPRADLEEGSTEVQRKAYVERAAAIALANNISDKAFFDHCAFVGHQDVIYGGKAINAGFYDCDVFGACDYIFGPMTAVFAKCDLVLNVGADSVTGGTPDNNDVAYITAAQNAAGVNGYLMYNCHIRSVVPGTENQAETATAIQHYFGRPWQGSTAETVFFETSVDKVADGQSLIHADGWHPGLAKSAMVTEYHTHEAEGVPPAATRVDWSGGIQTEPVSKNNVSLKDYATWLGGWDPFGGKDMAIVCPDAEKVTGITLKDGADAAAASYELTVGDTKELTVAVEPSTADQTFNVSGATEAVSVTKAEGKITISADAPTTEAVVITVASSAAKADGTAATATVSITVKPIPVTGITVTGPEGATATELFVGTEQTVQLAAAVAPENATEQGVTWTSDNEKVTVSETGLVTVAADAAPAAVKITAASKETGSTVKGEYTIILKPVLVTGITVTGPEGATASDIVIGTEQTVQLTAAVAPENATEQGVTWTSDNEKVTVSETGLVTVAADAEVGTATITATTKEAGSTIAGTYVITLRETYKPVETVTVTAAAAEVAQGGTVQLTAKVEPEGADPKVTWTSDNEKVTVDETGLVTVAADATPGKVTITATSVGKDDADAAVTGTVEITVVAPADALAAAIKAAQDQLDDTMVSEDGTDVSKRDVWTTQTVRDTMQDALDAAKAVAEKEGVTPAELIAATETLKDATADFVAAQKEGTKRNTGTPSYGSGSRPTTTKTETSTNDKGDVATTTTTPDGDRTITVVNKDGETVAEIKLPATIPTPTTKFKDVPEGHWAEESINHMAGLGMVKGVNEAQDLFDMESTMTRASVATMFFRLSNGKTGIASTFEDVAEGQWYTDAIGWAAKTGVVTGYSETAFGPDDTITRQQLAVMLQRYANLVGMDAKAHASALDPFVDGAEADDWAVEGLAWCVKNGIMKGRGGDVLDPTAQITRTEATAMFDRMIAMMKK